MEPLLLILFLAVFILPSFFMMRTQRKRQAEVQQLQSSLSFGDQVVTASGLHGTITGIREADVDLALAPGVEVTMEKMAIIRHAQAQDQQLPGEIGGYPGQDSGDHRGFRDEGYPDESNGPGEEGPRDGGHPENLR